MPAPKATDQLSATTPLGSAFLLTGFHGSEGISRLFHFQLDLVAENQTEVPFDQLLGQPVTVHLGLPKGKQRHWNGIVSRVSQGERDEEFTSYRLEMAPQFWLWSRRVQSRIFQHQNIPDILKEVLKGLDVKFEIQGPFHPRNYCTQYAESDFAFASRLMEEEGIYYYFKHADGAHQLVVANTPQSHVDVPEYPKAIFETVKGGKREDDRVWTWAKSQEICSGKYTLWDHTFELPGKNLAAETVIADSVAVGKVAHKLKVAGNDQLETYVFPGGYAHRYDGIDKSGGERPAELEKIFEDNQRTCRLRMEEGAARSLKIEGTGGCGQFTAGHKFTLERHFNADGAYVLTTLDHDARIVGDLRKSHEQALEYKNSFTCLPAALPFRPPRTTPKPLMHGTQTATVVGPPGEKISCDKYGRVKIQFHWDRAGKKDADSSCWLRVSQTWGGAGWGGMQLPHVGQEVEVAFEDGDLDRPFIAGRMYNAEAMPPIELPAGKSKNAFRDHGGNEIIMEGEKGQEQIRIASPYSETTMLIGAPHSPGDGFHFTTQAYVHWIVTRDWITQIMGGRTETILKNDTLAIGGSRKQAVAKHNTELVGGHQAVVVTGNSVESVIKNKSVSVKKNLAVGVKQNATVGIGQNLAVAVKQNLGLKVKQNLTESVDGDHSQTVKKNSTITVTEKFHLVGNTVDITGTDYVKLSAEKQHVTLSCGESRIVLKQDGTITISGKNIEIESTQDTSLEAEGQVNLQAKALLHLQGKPFQIQSESTGEVKTSAVMDINGAQVKINC